jgi:hypothetical protein
MAVKQTFDDEPNWPVPDGRRRKFVPNVFGLGKGVWVEWGANEQEPVPQDIIDHRNGGLRASMPIPMPVLLKGLEDRLRTVEDREKGPPN